MDTSPEYVAMCRAATELQEVKPWFAPGSDIEPAHDREKSYWSVELPRTVWLPRFDQLCEMYAKHLMENDPLGVSRCIAVAGVCGGLSGAFWHHKVESFEEIALRGLMFAKYHKTWNGKEWEKQ